MGPTISLAISLEGRVEGAKGPAGSSGGHFGTDGRRQVGTTNWRKSVGRSGHLGVCKGYASTNSKPTDHVGRGSTPAPGAGRLVSQRQDKLGL
jgi:hypothetical protein